MTYYYNGLSGQLSSTTVNVYQFGQVDGSGAMALCWLSNEISGSSYETLSINPMTGQVTMGWKVHTLSGWAPIHNRFLKPLK